MLVKFRSCHLLLLVCAILVAAASKTSVFPCCEEEVWEEVPCEEVATTSRTTTTSTTKPKPHTYAPTAEKPHTTARPPVKKKTKTRAPTTHSTSPASLTSTTASSAYNNCYCECKAGCKKFCRKVMVNGATQNQITQITKTTHRVPNGQLNLAHVHQQRFVPDPHIPYTPVIPVIPIKPNVPPAVYPIESPNKLANPYIRTNLAYKIQPGLPALPAPPPPRPQPVPFAYPQHAPYIYEEAKDTNIYPDALLESSYYVDELTRLLQRESLNKDAVYSYTQEAIGGPSYTMHGNVPPTPLPSAPIYQPASTIYGYSTPAPPAEQPKHESNSSASQYTAAALRESTQSYPSPFVPSAEPQYSNYVNKNSLSEPQLYGAVAPPSPPSQASSDQQSSASLRYHTAHDNPNVEYLNSIPYGSYYAPPATGYAPQADPYAVPYRI